MSPRQAFAILLIVVSTIAFADAMCTKNGIRFGQGQTISVPGQCMQVTCENAANNRQSGIICAYTQPSRGCRLSPTNYRLPYPQCCPVEVC